MTVFGGSSGIRRWMLVGLLMLAATATGFAQKPVWRQVTDAELAALLPARAPVEKEHIEDAVTTLGKQQHIQVSGDHAYVVMGATCDYRQQGKPVHENVIVTLALHKVENRWRLSGWIWGRL